ncbi:MAG TPA: PIN domain-containing protein [Acetomicrobium flavidum]|mgnify:FL=1|uniref:PIN/TRAM domain-containing protein n=1 Tax=Acetomicrobium flavidum TaxID=49896 RepID=UPI002C357E61|nr:PIN domain-containing protein [Acetomicrobium flavidum]
MQEGMGRLVNIIIRTLLSILGAIAGYQLAQYLSGSPWWPKSTLMLDLSMWGLVIVFSAFIGYLLAPLFIRGIARIGQIFERSLQSFTWQDLFVAILGLIVGLIVANLLAMPLSAIPNLGFYLAILLNIILGYIGLIIFLRRKDEIVSMWSSFEVFRDRFHLKGKRTREEDMHDNIKILDTSALIDGRILDIAKVGFIEGTLCIPAFVLLELQAIADSTDPLRRAKGRRGMEVVEDLQKLPDVKVEILEQTLKELKVDTVDEGLIELAKKLRAKIITTDYNLNKIASIQGLSVLNVNDLANALKPVLIPGETLEVDVIKEGKEPNQGVAYLTDGTMLVVEDGEKYIGKRVEVVITSMLQTSAGRMIFGRVKREAN